MNSFNMPVNEHNLGRYWLLVCAVVVPGVGTRYDSVLIAPANGELQLNDMEQAITQVESRTRSGIDRVTMLKPIGPFTVGDAMTIAIDRPQYQLSLVK